MDERQQRRRHFASQRAKHRRRRRVAFAVLVAAVAVPTLVLTAFRGSGSSSAASQGPLRGGKVKARIVRHAATGATAAAQKRAVRRLLRLGLPLYCAGGKGHYVALTFDDGPSDHTPGFLTVLAAAHIRATFFIVGGNMPSATYAEYARRETKLGALADHTYTHAMLTRLAPSEVVSQIGDAKKAIVDATGAPVWFFRPPFGARNAEVASVAHRFGLVQVLWNVDSRDWTGQHWTKTADAVTPFLKPGAIVLMHDTRPESIKALQYGILPALRLRGLKAVTLPELLALDPPSDAQLRANAAAGACVH